MREVQAVGRKADSAGAWRWLGADSLHLTVRFLGESPAARLGELANRLRPLYLATAPFSATSTGVITLPQGGAPRVLGVAMHGPGLAALARETERVVADLGWPAEARTFFGHISLARTRPGANPAAALACLRGLRARTPNGADCALRVKSVTMFWSELTPRGAIYTPVESFALRGANQEEGKVEWNRET